MANLMSPECDINGRILIKRKERGEAGLAHGESFK